MRRLDYNGDGEVTTGRPSSRPSAVARRERLCQDGRTVGSTASGSGGDGASGEAPSVRPDTPSARHRPRPARLAALSGERTGGGRKTPEPDLTGRTLLHFHIVEQLGAGGMGVVYKAIDEKLRRPVALKVLSARLLNDGRHRETLLREARSAASVNHPNIASIHEVHEGPEGAFFVMELVEGETLRARLTRTGPMPAAEALRVALDIARGLARAHAANVVHRDLKCENVMLTRDGHVKLLDFGVWPRCSGRGRGAPSTATDGVIGTAAYMAPEQARAARNASFLSDQYSLGVMLYQCLTGELPFATAGVYELLVAIMTASLAAPGQRDARDPRGARRDRAPRDEQGAGAAVLLRPRARRCAAPAGLGA